MVVRSFRLPEWSRLVFHDELDIVGPVAASRSARQGCAVAVQRLLPRADHGRGARWSVLLSGVFGDELLTGGWAWRRENRSCNGANRSLPPIPCASPSRWSPAVAAPVPSRARTAGRRDLQHSEAAVDDARSLHAVVAAREARSRESQLTFRGRSARPCGRCGPGWWATGRWPSGAETTMSPIARRSHDPRFVAALAD